MNDEYDYNNEFDAIELAENEAQEESRNYEDCAINDGEWCFGVLQPVGDHLYCDAHVHEAM